MKQFFIVAAEQIKPSEIGLTDPATDPNATVASILNTVYTWAGIICVLVIVIAGILYTTSTANPSHTKRAREAIIYAVVGLIVIIMAFTITQFVLGRF
ncbi:MAG TPA: hypothetical protein VFT59_00920 [Candidatus Saccharimonadales bacterium]|nr:hypothetical protein [Candidatus Saccharimonadales bacterium]